MGLKNKISGAGYFLISIIFGYVVIYFLNNALFKKSIESSFGIFLKVLPVFILIFILMAIANYFITPKFIITHIEGKKIRKWIFAVVGGILSSGPIYMWYPLLADLNKKGVNYGLIACFLYNRAIKIPLIPIMLIYFGWKYIIVLSMVMILASILQGIIINKLMGGKK